MIAAECEQHNGLHVTADNLYVEVVANGRLCEPGERGEILLTDLHNYGMPLIRYKVGDVGSWKGDSCACGRGLPLLNVVEGRTLDLLSTPEGGVVAGEFFPCLLKDFAAIRRYQVIQEQRDELTIRLALDEPLPDAQSVMLRDAVARAFGPRMHVNWQMDKDIVIEQGQKFRPVLSRVPVSLEQTPSS